MTWTEKRYAKKRLSQEQAKDDAGQQPEAADTDGPPALEESLSLPPNVTLIEPKSEPEEQESKWTIPLFSFSICVWYFLVIYPVNSVCTVFAVQVKVEEVEMESPIKPANIDQPVSLSLVKQEEGGEQAESRLQSSLENTPKEEGTRKEASGETREKLGSMEQSVTGKINTQEGENEKRSGIDSQQKLLQNESRGGDSATEDISESSTEQDTQGETSGGVGPGSLLTTGDSSD